MPNYVSAYGEVVTRGIRTLTQQTNIRQLVTGGKARSILEVHAREVDNLSVQQDRNLQKAFLPTSHGQWLDHFGATTGITKYPQRNAEALATDRVFKFFVEGGATFSTVNGGSGITITEGTTLTAPARVAFEENSLYGDIDTPDTIHDRSIHYSVTSDATALSTDTELFVSAKCLTPGVNGNLASPKMIRSHNFTGYSDYLGRGLKVENSKAVLNGVQEESVASFRYRISKALTSAEKANNIAITNAILTVPGVADVIILPWEDGVGRFNVYIKSISSVVSDMTIVDAQAALDEVLAVGNRGYVRKPYEIGVEIDSVLTFKERYNDEVKDEIRENLTISAIRYLNSLDLGQPLIISQLVQEIKQTDGRVRTVGFNGVTLFDGVYVWYPARLADTGRRRERLIIGTLSIPIHARIMAETTLSDPVRLG